MNAERTEFKITYTPNLSELIISLIKGVCDNVDDLNKIMSATEALLEEKRFMQALPTLQQQQQLLMYTDNEKRRLLV
jgi:hypothetical protein